MLRDLFALAVHLVGLYVALAVMVIGFVIMIGGLNRSGLSGTLTNTWVGGVARFLLIRPLELIASAAAALVRLVLTRAGRLIAWSGRAIITYIIDPIVIALGRVLRRLVFPRRR